MKDKLVVSVYINGYRIKLNGKVIHQYRAEKQDQTINRINTKQDHKRMAWEWVKHNLREAKT